ncbi:MAG: metal ABC transporter permease [Candidatus Micrarchaeota archaeon]|nr:metal ABC transporter permease [Candidatus Micrarchaeota archaeon]
MLIEILNYPFFQRAIITGLLLSVSCAILGVFLILRRMALIGDGISHIAFSGIILGLFLNIYPFEIAIIFTLIFSMLIVVIKEKFKIKNDVALGIVFTIAMALGITLLSVSENINIDIHYFLFGSIISVTQEDVIYSMILFAIVITFVLSNYKQLFYVCFDETNAMISGINAKLLNILLVALTAILTIVSIKIIGVLLVSSFLIIPAATAILLSDSFRKTLVYSSAFASLAVISGLFLSYLLDVSSGGLIVLMSGLYFLITGLVKNFVKN